MRKLLPVPVCLFVPSLLTAQVGGSLGEYEHFTLYTNCAPVSVSVAISYETEEAEAMAEARLRAARLYGGGFTNRGVYLTVMPELGSRALTFDVWSLEFGKWLQDPMTGTTFRAVTWRQTFKYEGTRDERSALMLADLSSALDDFIGEYLRVNGESC